MSGMDKAFSVSRLRLEHRIRAGLESIERLVDNVDYAVGTVYDACDPDHTTWSDVDAGIQKAYEAVIEMRDIASQCRGTRLALRELDKSRD